MEGSAGARDDHDSVLRIAHGVHQYDADDDVAGAAAIARKGELHRGSDFYLSDHRVCNRQHIGKSSDLRVFEQGQHGVRFRSWLPLSEAVRKRGTE